MTKLLAIIAFIFASAFTHAEVLVFTYAFNRADFIKIQHDTLNEFLLEDYKFIVFNDARDPNAEKQINEMCTQLNIQCIRIPQEIHNQPYLPRLPREDRQCPTVRNVNVVQYSLDTLGFDHDDIVILLDSDMFLVKSFSVREFMYGYALGGAKTGNGYVEFLWHALAILDMRNMPNKRTLTFNCGEVDGHPIDAGGHSHYYIKNNPEAHVHFMSHVYAENLQCYPCRSTNQTLCPHNIDTLKAAGFDAPQIEFIQKANQVEFFHNNSFLHYRNGSNWDHKSAHFHQMKTEALHKYLAEILK